MLQIIKETKISWMAHRRWAYMFSIAVMLLGLASVAMHKGFRLGVDFTGGRLIEYRFTQDISAEELRSTMANLGFPGAEIQRVGEGNQDYLLRLPVAEGEQAAGERSVSAKLLDALQQSHPGLGGELRKEELVGPKVGKELRGKAFTAVTLSLLAILIYVAVRYEWRLALGGVAALAHDVIVTLLMCSVFNVEITISIIAALMTIGGYSINDTVVVFDRIREEMKLHAGQPLAKIIDTAVNKTLSRTILTSFTTFMSACALFFLGGEVIRGFAFAMMVGVGFGTFSSVYVASALALDITQASERRAHAKAA